MIRVRMALALIAVTVAASACSPLGLGSSRATWDTLGPITAASTTITVGVQRAECSSGVTGELLDPVVTYDDDRITILALAAPNGMSAADCQENDIVPQTIELSEAVGDRELFDGICNDADAKGYAWCASDAGVRWTSDGAQPPAKPVSIGIATGDWIVVESVLATARRNARGGDSEAYDALTRIRQAAWDAAAGVDGPVDDLGWPGPTDLLSIRLDEGDGARILTELDLARGVARESESHVTEDAVLAAIASFTTAWEARR